ncbi:MAG: XRE family transcriptional regulator [Lachnospiraceae bacterium]|nr:XRE family transcriptional regulator [Lachnospiraceae bacterium]
MANITEKTSSNVFYKARCRAAKYNGQLGSREGAADIMSIDRGRLYRIESGIANPYPEEVHLMADLYNAPELRNYYCREMCPLGSDVPVLELEDLDRITVRAMASLRKVAETEKGLLDITLDGVITDDEKPKLRKILTTLDEISAITQSLKVWAEKNLEIK